MKRLTAKATRTVGTQTATTFARHYAVPRLAAARPELTGVFIEVGLSVHHVMIIDWFNKFVSSRAILPSFTLLL